MKTKALATAIAMAISGSSEALTVTGGFTGSWYDAGAPGQGFVLEVVDQAEARRGVVYWFTYDSSGNPLWLLGTGMVEGNQITFEMDEARGGVLDANGFNADQVELTSWGTLTLSFSDCLTGTARWDSATSAGSGMIPITRLTKIRGAACSGGISDDSGNEYVDLERALSNPGVFPFARGRVRYEQGLASARLEVQVEGLPTGEYQLRIGGTDRGTLDVMPDGSSSRAEMEFESPAQPGEQLLSFDVMDKQVEVLDGNQVVLMAPISTDNPQDGETPKPAPEPLEVQAALRRAASFASGNANAEFERNPSDSRFMLRLRDVPEALYDVLC